MLAEFRFYFLTTAFWRRKSGPIAQLRLERTPDKREVSGSSPLRPTRIPYSTFNNAFAVEGDAEFVEHFF